jgi:Flp pilus assembly protein TadD
VIKSIRAFCKGQWLLAAALAAALTGCATAPPRDDADATAVGVDKLLASADEAVRLGKLDAAIVLYTEVLNQQPSAEIWLKAADVQRRLGRDREAAYAYGQVLELEPNNIDARERLGLMLVERDQPEPARYHLEWVIALDPGRWRSHNALGVLADLDRDYPTAISHYRAALAVQPNSAMLHNNLGYSLYLSGDLDGAGAAYVEAISLDHDYAPARRNLALLYARKGAYTDAIELLATVVSEPAAYNDVGYVALLKEDYPAAERLLAEAVERSPTYYETAARNLEIARQKLKGSQQAERHGAG